MITIAEPKSRPHHLHEYELTRTSLYAAASIDLKKDDIIKILDNFCKNKTVPPIVEEKIEECTKQYGRAKLILQQNKYYIEAETPDMEKIKTLEYVKRAMENVKINKEKRRL